MDVGDGKVTLAEREMYKEGSSSGILMKVVSSVSVLPTIGFFSVLIGEAISRHEQGSHFLWSLFVFTLFVPVLVALARFNENRAHGFTLSLRPALEAKYRVALEVDCVQVGISFESRDRFNSRQTFWDVGFLTIGDRLVYFGHERWFDLRRDDIVRVRIRACLVASGAPRLYLDYRDPATDNPKRLVIQARVGASRTKQFAELQRLRAQIAFLPDGVTGHLLGLPGKA